MLARLATALALSIASLAATADAAELVNVPSRNGITQGLFVDAPSATPAWVVVLFAGDDGAMRLTASGPLGLRGNFLIRTASYWTGLGDATAIFDAPSDYAGGMNDVFRLSDDAAQDVAAAVAELRKRFPTAKIALVGTSRGTVTVGNVLRRQPALADAYVLTSPVTTATGRQPGLAGVHWTRGSERVLVMSNEHDGCMASPFGAAKRLATDNGFDFIAESSDQGGGDRQSDCGARSPHGYLGIEPKALGDINDWLNGKPVAPTP